VADSVLLAMELIQSFSLLAIVSEFYNHGSLFFAFIMFPIVMYPPGSSASSSTLSVHQRKSFCKPCGKKFKSLKALTMHNRHKHPTTPAAAATVSDGKEQEVFKRPSVPPCPANKKQCPDCGGCFLRLLDHKKCSQKLVHPDMRREEYQVDTDSSLAARSTDVESDSSDGSSNSGLRRSSRTRIGRRSGEDEQRETVFKTPDLPPTPGNKQQCPDCGKLFVNHHSCRKRPPSSEFPADDNRVCDESNQTSQSTDPESSSSETSGSNASGIPQRKKTGRRHKKAAHPRHAPAPLTPPSVPTESEENIDNTPDGDTEQHGGTTRSHRLAKSLDERLKELRKKYLKPAAPRPEDPLLRKLTEYHRRLSSEVDNFLTEKLSDEVLAVIDNPNVVDEVKRPFMWTEEDVARLNKINADAKTLEVPDRWIWAAKKGTAQYEYSHARMQLAVTDELEFKIIHCKQCKSTGLLVGLDQIHADVCIDCLQLNNTKDSKKKQDKVAAWEEVRGPLEYPKQVDRDEFLPTLSQGDKAVISPVQAVVSIKKNSMCNKVLRQECITLKRNPANTWVHILPRDSLKDRFVIIERTAKDSRKRHIIADAEKVRAWLAYLFHNHQQFIRMRADGELNISEDALRSLEGQSELAEVCDDHDGTESESEDVEPEEGIVQPALQSGFSSHEVFTVDRYPALYVRAQDMIRIKKQVNYS